MRSERARRTAEPADVVWRVRRPVRAPLPPQLVAVPRHCERQPDLAHLQVRAGAFEGRRRFDASIATDAVLVAELEAVIASQDGDHDVVAFRLHGECCPLPGGTDRQRRLRRAGREHVQLRQ